MKKALSTFLVGFIFAMGLGISGMIRPSNVQGFLNIWGEWRPALIFVMIGAILVHSIAYPLIMRRKSPLLDSKFYVPNRKDITPHLIVGAMLFGMGWGIGGFCPGPALVSLAGMQSSTLVFLISMFAGMFIFKWMPERIRKT